MFKFDEICELIKLVSSSGVAQVEIEHAGSRVRIEGRSQAGVAASASPASAQAPPTADPPAASADAPTGEAPAPPEGDDLHPIASPIVGTFYRAPNPDADPYVKVGDFVEKGQTLCIVEAMKLMNEIECDISGTIVKVLQENAQPVEFGEDLFLVRPA
ncbi:MAG: acetyl-CoA carboxylase biotin carboxyl carrier protein [Acidobacteria bacterium]|jgi:acetyl-CoA carboxylase biotin carboxyl carrier protein|nr:acetyl-CoA carboxylase biotin carboxyl carrier protein [Acidobacteriota bacterium]